MYFYNSCIQSNLRHDVLCTYVTKKNLKVHYFLKYWNIYSVIVNLKPTIHIVIGTWYDIIIGTSARSRWFHSVEDSYSTLVGTTAEWFYHNARVIIYVVTSVSDNISVRFSPSPL